MHDVKLRATGSREGKLCVDVGEDPFGDNGRHLRNVHEDEMQDAEAALRENIEFCLVQNSRSHSHTPMVLEA